MVKIIFLSSDGRERTEAEGEVGERILDVAHANDIDIEGTCEGCMACSTCHVIVDEDSFRRLPPASEFEEDLLDLAAGLQPTSRLGCQIIVSEELDGMILRLPKGVRNLLI